MQMRFWSEVEDEKDFMLRSDGIENMFGNSVFSNLKYNYLKEHCCAGFHSCALFYSNLNENDSFKLL